MRERVRLRSWVVALASFPFLWTTGSARAEGAATSEWAVLLYLDADMVGQDEDFAEEFRSWVDASRSTATPIVALYDRPQDASAAVGGLEAWTHPRLLRIDRGQVVPIAGGDWAERDMGNPEVLADFLTACDAEVRANHYVFFGIGHGGGLRGAFSDQEHGSDGGGTETPLDNLHAGEWARALDGFAAARPSRRPFDLFVLDSCCMGTLEVAHALAPYANWLVLSEDQTETLAFPVAEMLARLAARPDTRGGELARLLVDGYRPAALHASDIAALVDADKVLPLVAETSSLATLLSQRLGRWGVPGRAAWERRLQQVAPTCTPTGGGLDDGGFCEEGPALRDLGQLALVLRRSTDSGIAKRAGQVLRALASAVVDIGSAGNPQGLHGLSIDVCSCGGNPDCSAYAGQPISLDSQWDEFLHDLEVQGCAGCTEASCEDLAVTRRGGSGFVAQGRIDPIDSWCGRVDFVAGEGVGTSDATDPPALVRQPVSPGPDGTVRAAWDGRRLELVAGGASIPLVPYAVREVIGEEQRWIGEAELTTTLAGSAAPSRSVILRYSTESAPSGEPLDSVVGGWGLEAGSRMPEFVRFRAGLEIRAVLDFASPLVRFLEKRGPRPDAVPTNFARIERDGGLTVRRVRPHGTWFAGFELQAAFHNPARSFARRFVTTVTFPP